MFDCLKNIAMQAALKYNIVLMCHELFKIWRGFMIHLVYTKNMQN